MSLIEKVNEITEKAKGQLKPDLKKYGKNFRAISESAVLEVLNPLFKQYDITYEPVIVSKNLTIEKINCGRDQSGNLIQRLVFVAEVHVRLFLGSSETATVVLGDDGKPYKEASSKALVFDGWGSGVDSGDKATGKAYTAAVKYALFKGLRLQYSDDPDVEASEDIEDIVEEAKMPSGSRKEEKENKKEKSKEKEEPLASEKQLSYIKGLAVSLNLSDEAFKEKFGVSITDKFSMRKARDIIEKLSKMLDDDLPF